MNGNRSQLIKVLSAIPIFWGEGFDVSELHNFPKCSQCEMMIQKEMHMGIFERSRFIERPMLENMFKRAQCLTSIRVLRTKMYISYSNFGIMKQTTRLYMRVNNERNKNQFFMLPKGSKTSNYFMTDGCIRNNILQEDSKTNSVHGRMYPKSKESRKRTLVM